MSWQEDYFDEAYIDFYKESITQERTTAEVDFLISVFDIDTKTVLDAPCGFGRHSTELAKRGFTVHGVDLFDSQLRIAKANGDGITGLSFEKADIRKFISSDFDAAINIFTSFGYFGKEDDRKVLRNLIRSVSIGGLIVLDVRNPIRLIQEFSEGDWKLEHNTGDIKGFETYDPITSINSVKYTRGNIVKQADIHVYSPRELIEWCTAEGAIIEHLYGGFTGKDYDPKTSSRLILLARRLQ